MNFTLDYYVSYYHLASPLRQDLITMYDIEMYSFSSSCPNLVKGSIVA